MKKIILSIVAILAFGFTNAQDIKSKKGETYLPEEGDWAIGFNANNIFSYLGNSFNGKTNNGVPSVDYEKAGAFVGKKFISDKNAYRVVANFRVGSSSTTTPNVVVAGTTTTTTETKLSNSGFNLQVGVGKEWRKGKTRLQGFYGADALLFVNTGKTTNDVNVNSVTTVGTTVTTSASSSKTVNKNGLGLGVGVNGFLGAEYFLFPKISIGAQYSWGINIGLNGKSNVTTSTSATGVPSTNNSVDGGKGSNFNVGGVGVSSLNLTLHF